MEQRDNIDDIIDDLQWALTAAGYSTIKPELIERALKEIQRLRKITEQ